MVRRPIGSNLVANAGCELLARNATARVSAARRGSVIDSLGADLPWSTARFFLDAAAQSVQRKVGRRLARVFADQLDGIQRI